MSDFYFLLFVRISPYQENIPLKRIKINEISDDITMNSECHFVKVSIKLKNSDNFIVNFGQSKLEK